MLKVDTGGLQRGADSVVAEFRTPVHGFQRLPVRREYLWRRGLQVEQSRADAIAGVAHCGKDEYLFDLRQRSDALVELDVGEDAAIQGDAVESGFVEKASDQFQRDVFEDLLGSGGDVLARMSRGDRRQVVVAHPLMLAGEIRIQRVPVG